MSATATSAEPRQPARRPGPARTLADLPGPRGLPLLGNALQVDPGRVHLILEDWARQYGPMYRIGFGPRQVLVISDFELVTQVFQQRPDTYRRVSTVEPVLRELGVDGVFSAEGATWQRQRKLVMPAFSMRQQRELFPTVAETTAHLRDHWRTAAAAGALVDARTDLMRYTVDVTSHLVFGRALGTLGGAQPELQEHLSRIFHTVNLRVNSVLPYWRLLKLPRDRAADRSAKFAQAFIRGLIDQARGELAKAPPDAPPKNLLHAMLVTQQAENPDDRLSDAAISGNVLTFLLAGEDTTSNTLSWILHYMAWHPEVQQRLREEARAVLGEGTLVERYEDVAKLKYAVAVTQEVLRMRSAAPTTFNETLKDVELGGLALPTGTWVFALTRLCGLENQHFADAQTFKPERWLATRGSDTSNNADSANSTGDTAAHNGRAMLAFGGGPRTCPGRSLALLECAMVASMVARNFEVQPVGKIEDVEERFDFTMYPHGLRVGFRALPEV